MVRLKAKISYDGTGFSGFQIQPNARTVQEELEKALTKMHKDAKKVTGSGRTDAGVHAKGQVVHFDSNLRIPLEKWPVALNALLPDDIAVLQVEKVAKDFHARFDVTGKTYKYFVYTDQIRNPLKRHYAAHYPLQIDHDAMKTAASYLIGTHDFTSFCSAKTEVENKVRTITDIQIEKLDDQVVFTFTGNGFLYNMVRILVGTLLDIGSGKIEASTITEILDAKDRTAAGKTAPAEGLYLWEVYYRQ